MNTKLTRSGETLKELFMSLKEPRDVANLLEVEYSRLIYHIHKYPESKKYTTFTISKRNGEVREIRSPISPIKILQKKLNVILQHVYTPKPSVYSFIPNRSILDNAKQHLGRKYVFNLDLKDFFPSIHFGRVRGMFIGKPYNLPPSVATILAQICCWEGVLPQGAPTSPIISNMICARMDSELQKLARECRCTYCPIWKR